ncbi:hypothetical protein CDAR_315831 [Caerostris darwini]|uniref:Uncharacterized protein n=1 Tax=Caerostris darwini TaxID=1538125 RepID=A0AAV4UW46_9ARAC|nr:hypothetical protein CDAR_315831 [Caerostris darwini]
MSGSIPPSGRGSHGDVERMLNASINTRQQTPNAAQMIASGLCACFKPVADENQSGSIPPSKRKSLGDVEKLL